jgi:hypothetical protein
MWRLWIDDTNIEYLPPFPHLEGLRAKNTKLKYIFSYGEIKYLHISDNIRVIDISGWIADINARRIE